MIFLNLALAGGLAAVLAPLLIQFLHRRKVVARAWGAMMFLADLAAQEGRTLRARELLLLLLRSLLILCVVLAVMRPAVRGTAVQGGRPTGANTSAVLLIDDSFSMNAGRSTTAWSEACDQALRYAATLRKGDDIAVMFTSTAGRSAAPVAVLDKDRVEKVIREAAPNAERSDVPTALLAAIQHLDTQHHPRRELVLFSDMQANSFAADDGARWSTVAAALRDSKVRPSVIFAGIPRRGDENLSFESLSPSRAVVDCFTPAYFNATVVNHGREHADGVRVTFSVDGLIRSEKTLDLPPNGRAVATFEHRFAKPGSHAIACRLNAAGDMLQEDNEVFHSVAVIDRLPVLLVDGSFNERPLASETGFLQLALAPRDPQDATWQTVIEPTVVESNDLRYADLSRYRAVILANVPALPAPVVADLERFVIGGGGLMIALGDQVVPAAYNRDLYRQGAGVLPVAIRKTELLSGPNVLPGENPGKDPWIHLGGIVPNAGSLDLFRPERGQDWSRARIRGSAYVTPPGEGVRVLATYSNGEPFLLQKPIGEGKVMLMTTSLDMEWSDLPVHPFFVPLMQNLVFDLASAVIPPRNIPVGQTLFHVAAGDAATKIHLLAPPKGEPTRMRMQRQGSYSVFTSEGTQAPGLYSVTPQGGGDDARTFYAVLPDAKESDLRRIDDADLRRLERDVGIQRTERWEDLAGLIEEDSGTREISKYFIAAALVLCLAEIALARRWS